MQSLHNFMKRFALTTIYLLTLLAVNPAQDNKPPAGPKPPPASPELTEVYQLSAQLRSLFQAGKFNEALPLAERIIQLADKATDANPKLQADVRGNLAEVLLGQKEYAKGVTIYQDVLSRYENIGPSALVKQLQILDRLVFAYSAMKEYKQAEKISAQTILLCEKSFGVDSPQLIVALAARAQVEFRQNNYGTASRFFDRARQISEKHNGPQHLATGQLMESAAWTLYFDGGDTKIVEANYLRALDIKVKALGENTPEVKTTLLRLANFYRYQNRPLEADPFFLRAIVVEDILPPLEDENGPASAITQYDCFLDGIKQTAQQKAFFAQRAADRKRLSEASADGEVLNGRAIELPRPVYPRLARDARASGKISVQVIIDETGKVIKAHSRCGGFPPLADAAIAAALKARFTPTLLNGRPVKVTGVINYNFVAQ